MEIEKTITVQVTEDGMIPIPTELREGLGIKPLQFVYLKKNKDHLVMMLSRREIGERIVDLLKEGLAGFTQTDLDQERALEAYWE